MFGLSVCLSACLSESKLLNRLGLNKNVAKKKCLLLKITIDTRKKGVTEVCSKILTLETTGVNSFSLQWNYKPLGKISESLQWNYKPLGRITESLQWNYNPSGKISESLQCNYKSSGYLNPSSGILNPQEGYLNPSSGIINP